MLQRLADLLEQSLEELAQAESKDQGERGLCWPLPSLSRPEIMTLASRAPCGPIKPAHPVLLMAAVELGKPDQQGL